MDRFQHLLTVKPEENSNRRIHNYLHNETIYVKPISRVIINVENLKLFPVRIKTWITTHSILIHCKD